MTIDLLLGGTLLAVFLIGTLTKVNIGTLGLIGAFLLSTLVLNESMDDLLGGFPANLFVLLFGITYLFSVASANGTIDWIILKLATLVRGNAKLVPIVLFGVTALATSGGAPGQAAAGIMAPIGLRLAQRYGIAPLLPSLMIILGVGAGTFSPLSVLGIVANAGFAEQGFAAAPILLWLATFIFNVVLAVVVYLVMGGHRIASQSIDVEEHRASAGGNAAVLSKTQTAVASRVTTANVLTLITIVGVAGGALAFGLDIGFLAICGGALLHVLFPREDAAKGVSWNVILLVCGLVTLIEVLDRAGTIERVGTSVAGVGNVVVGALLICFVAGLVSAFASSTGVIGALVPLSAPLMASGDISPMFILIAVALSATVVDASPFSSVGALVTASAPAEEQQRLSRRLLIFSLSMIIIIPLVTVGIFVLPGYLL
ncbi:SLC13 family permease [Cellulosimicrobium funkei]|nr:SLC13 family permease [Cellulosimicrobium funkei]